MKCAKVKRYLFDYADGTLRPRLTDQVEEHVRRCEPCREEERTARFVSKGLRGWNDVALPEDGLHRLETRLAFSPLRPEEVRRDHSVLSFLLPYAAGLATAASLMFLVWHPWQTPPKASAASAPAAVVPAAVVPAPRKLSADVPRSKERPLQYTDSNGRLLELPWNAQADAILRSRLSKEMYRSLRSSIERADFQVR